MKKICIVSFPWAANSSYVFLSDFIRILDSFSLKMVLIDGNTKRIKTDSGNVELIDIGTTSHYVKDIRPMYKSVIIWLFNYVIIQLKLSVAIIKHSRDSDAVFFYMAYPHFLLPLITAKLLNKKTVEFATRSKNRQSRLEKMLSLQDWLYNNLLDYISPESRSLSAQFNDKIGHKILPPSARFIDDDFYRKRKNIADRRNIAAYVGRLSREKGVMTFVDSRKFLTDRTTEYIVIGKGILYEDIKACANGDIKLIDWVPHDELPAYLNDINILVLPSDSEGLPTIIIEAMACGTIVFVTPVGGVPDVIIDGVNGFIIDDNTPEGIARGIDRILKTLGLEEISQNAVLTVQNHYTFPESVKRYKAIMERLGLV